MKAREIIAHATQARSYKIPLHAHCRLFGKRSAGALTQSMGHLPAPDFSSLTVPHSSLPLALHISRRRPSSPPPSFVPASRGPAEAADGRDHPPRLVRRGPRSLGRFWTARCRDASVLCGEYHDHQYSILIIVHVLYIIMFSIMIHYGMLCYAM